MKGRSESRGWGVGGCRGQNCLKISFLTEKFSSSRSGLLSALQIPAVCLPDVGMLVFVDQSWHISQKDLLCGRKKKAPPRIVTYSLKKFTLFLTIVISWTNSPKQ